MVDTRFTVDGIRATATRQLVVVLATGDGVTARTAVNHNTDKGITLLCQL